MRWAVEHLGVDAVVFAGQGTTDHARAAIQLLSQGAPKRTVFTHTGWRRIEGCWVYLHGGGAIGGNGAVQGIEVDLPDALAPFVLPSPSDEARRACGKVLDLLRLGPTRLTVPAIACVIRAIIGGADFSYFLYGRTGRFKSELAALLQQFFGAGFDSRHFPANFGSTANHNEALAFATKDAVLVVDEFKPPASGSERERMYRDAARLLRAQGNRAGRGRMRADTTLRPEKAPRGLIAATGEELPSGESLRKRLVLEEVNEGDINSENLTLRQTDAADGWYAQFTSSFVSWLAQRYDEARKDFEDMVRDLRPSLRRNHPRTADIQAQLAASCSVLLCYLLEVGEIDECDAEWLKAVIGAALDDAMQQHDILSGLADPVGTFARLLSSAIAAGKAHIAHRGGTHPEGHEAACGWRLDGSSWQPQGDRVGWLDRDSLFLEPHAAYGAARRMVSDGSGVEVTVVTLERQLRDRKLLMATDPKRRTLTVRRKVEGRQQDVLHLSVSFLLLSAEENADKADIGLDGADDELGENAAW
jgi:hypothetical protein